MTEAGKPWKGLDPVKQSRVFNTVPKNWSKIRRLKEKTGLSKNTWYRYVIHLLYIGEVQRKKCRNGRYLWRRTPEEEKTFGKVELFH